MILKWWIGGASAGWAGLDGVRRPRQGARRTALSAPDRAPETNGKLRTIRVWYAKRRISGVRRAAHDRSVQRSGGRSRGALFVGMRRAFRRAVRAKSRVAAR
jgi:hypothetical protein